MKSVVQDLLDIIELERLEDNLFRGQTRASGQKSIFGGLVAGQALMAASRTVDDERQVHSLHAYFLRPGDFNVPIVYDVDRIRDGQSFTTRRVNAIQHGRPIFSLAASFQREEQGVEHQVEMPDVPSPDALPSDEEMREQVAESIPERFREAFLQDRPVEFRSIKPANGFKAEAQDPTRLLWFRIKEAIEVDDATSRALLAYCSDFGLMGTALLPHGMNFFQPHLQAASIDHAMWFHRSCRVDEWLLYVMDSPSATSARGINRGLIYQQDGTLVASVVQEGLMRLRSSASQA